MEILVDTWNVLHQMGVLPPDLAGLGVGELASLLSKGRWSRDQIALICDGTTKDDVNAPSSNIEIFFTGGTKSADQEIMDRVARSSTANRIIVVTNDREIIRFIRAKGAQQLGSVEFLEAVADDHRRPNKKIVHKPSSLSPEKAAAWKEEFGFNKDDMADLQDELKNAEITEPESPPGRQENVPETPVKKVVKPQPPAKPDLPDDVIGEARRLAE
jgi:predicted RNA-binding protein with PIN domain